MITIILPVRNEAKYIRAVLDAVLTQTFPQDEIEILVADGMSTDGTREIFKEFQQSHPQIKLLDNPGKIVPIGMNIALRQARGEIVIRVDGHTEIAPNYVSNCVAALQRTGADNVGGCMTPIGTTPFGKAVATATSTPFGIGDSKFHYSTLEEVVDSVYMGAWNKEVFYKIGLFDEELVRNQDDEFNYRLRKFGGRIVLDPNIRSCYTTRSTPFSLWKQYYEYGLYKVRVLQKHPRQMSIRQFIPPLFVLGILASLWLLFLYHWGWVLFVLILGAYLVVNLVLSTHYSLRKNKKLMIELPLAYFIIHLSYGSGFLTGLFKFWNRWGDKKGLVPDE